MYSTKLNALKPCCAALRPTVTDDIQTWTLSSLSDFSPHVHSPPFPVSVHTLQSPLYIPHPSQSQPSLYSHQSTFPTLPSLSPHSTVTNLHSPPFPVSVLTLSHQSTFPTLPSLSPHSAVTSLHSQPFPVSFLTLQSPVCIPHPF